MATWAIGDVHGCFRTLRKLLKRIGFDSSVDRLWMTGDLVNRGPGSLETLEWAQELDERLTVVLGNHDLHLLAVAWGMATERSRDTLKEVLKSKRRDELLDWLRRRPLVARQDSHLLVHAGLLPEWTAKGAERIARVLEDQLAGEGAALLVGAYRDKGGEAEGFELRSLRALTMLRTLDGSGQPYRDFSGPPEEAPEGCIPWFDHAERRSGDVRVVCGHWAALGLRVRPDLVALDSGCAWGGRLSAVCLDDGRIEQVSNSE
ncbi:MAG: symmetrical bis(5'-nucleosyl)-tetraphosphatase [Acidobacteria bacterium]|nr:symmetrical bis(5'-nucleosyl)-tetraphosphatase [Acidobacteriota bacterium]MCB9378819.1 symmetrical bis(5'-nucleosyl)-tetraphosphatase [Holophagales bacterium]